MSGTSIGTSRIAILPLLKTMVQNCKNRLLTVHVAAAYELEPDTISYLTGSGKTTKKIKDILEEAIALREAEIHIESPSSDSFLSSNSSPTEELESFSDESSPQSDLSNFL
jgi:replication factor C large subunit